MIYIVCYASLSFVVGFRIFMYWCSGSKKYFSDLLVKWLWMVDVNVDRLQILQMKMILHISIVSCLQEILVCLMVWTIIRSFFLNWFVRGFIWCLDVNDQLGKKRKRKNRQTCNSSLLWLVKCRWIRDKQNLLLPPVALSLLSAWLRIEPRR